MSEQQGFTKQTYASPAEAFLASTMANSGVNWPRKNLGGKPKLTKGKGGQRGSRSLRHKKTS
jgi:hypothetical protein